MDRHLHDRPPGSVLPAAKDLETELECFNFYFTDEIMSKIETDTNAHIINLMDAMAPAELQALRKKAPYIQTTNIIELRAFFGLMILRGLYRQNYRKVLKFWKSIPIFSATMSYHRYYFLHHFIRFEDQQVIDDGWCRDRGVACRAVYEMWNDRLPQAVKVGKVDIYGEHAQFIVNIVYCL